MDGRKRARDAAVVELDPKMLLEAQHKALYEAVTRYKQQVYLLESEVEATASSKAALQDVVSLLGRQIEAVSAQPLPSSAFSFLARTPPSGFSPQPPTFTQNHIFVILFYTPFTPGFLDFIAPFCLSPHPATHPHT